MRFIYNPQTHLQSPKIPTLFTEIWYLKVLQLLELQSASAVVGLARVLAKGVKYYTSSFAFFLC